MSGSRSSPHRRRGPEAPLESLAPAPFWQAHAAQIARMGLSAAEQREIQAEIARNVALARSLRTGDARFRRKRPSKGSDVMARPITRYWKKVSEAKPPGTPCKGCGKGLPHSTYDERRACFLTRIMRKKATGAWQKRSKDERRRVLEPATRAQVNAKLNSRVAQLRMWLAPQILRVMGDAELKEIVFAYYKSSSTRFYEWLRARYHVTEACPKGHNRR